MTNIKLIVNGSSASAVASGRLTSGMVGVPLTIEYDDSWNGLIKTAVFRVGFFSRDRRNIGNSTTVPWEVMRYSGKPLEIGVEGRDADGNIVMPTIWATVSKILPGANASIPAAPNPDGGEIPSGDCASIDDSVITTDKTWSSQKIAQEIAGAGGGGSGTPYGVMYIPQELTEEQKAQARENIDVPSYQEFEQHRDDYLLLTSKHEEDILVLDARVDELEKGGGAEEKWELINTIEVTDEETSDIIFDNFCLKKFFLRVKFPGNENTASESVTMGFLEKRDNGSFHSFSTFTQSLLQPNTTRYASFWGTAFVGNPFEFYYIPAGSLADLNAPIYGRPYPEIVEKGLTRINVYGMGKLFPIGTICELWGVRV